MLLSKPGGLIDRDLRAFHRPQQRIPASCNEQQQPLLRPTEGWNKFRAVLDGQSAGGSGADIDQPAGVRAENLDSAILDEGRREPVAM